MKKSTTISTRSLEPKNLDYDFVYNEAIRYLQQMSGDIWTDYNIHDPGVTILEYLSYALTDLGYRTSLSVEDILYARTDGKKEELKTTLFSPEEIYSSAPLTPSDYRKLLLDNIAELQNCWVEKDDFISGQKGLYTVFLQLNDWVGKGQKDARTQAEQILSKNRNLGEDFSIIKFLRKLKISVVADLSVRNSVYAESVMAKILTGLECFFSVPVARFPLADLLKEGIPLEKILEGPTLKNGYFGSQKLIKRRKSIHIDEIKELLLDVEGVLNIQEIRFRVNGIATDKEVLLFEEDQFPVYDKSFMSESALPIEVRKNGRKVSLDLIEVKRIFNSEINVLQTRQSFHNNLQNQNKKALPNSRMNREDLAHYSSIQNLFPHIYGITKWGVPLRAPKAQRVKSKQLKGYLFLFEQFFSTYLSILSHLPRLFSISEKTDAPAFDFLPLDIPDVNSIIKNASTAGDEKTAEAEKKIRDFFYQFLPKEPIKNAILDHFLARFNEEFPQDQNKQKRVENKQTFLQNYPDLSRRRGVGYNYKKSGWDNENVSGLKQRISLKLGFPQWQNVSLTRHIFQGNRLRKFSKKDLTQKVYTAKLKIPVHDLLLYGAQKNAYHIVKKVTGYEAYFHSPEMKKHRLIYTADDFQTCQKAVENIRAEVVQISEKSTGFFMVDHILLRPKRTSNVNLYLKDKKGRILLENHEQVTAKELQRLYDLFLLIGADLDSYRLEEVSKTRGQFVLFDENQNPIMKSPNLFLLKDAEQEKAQISETLYYLRRHPEGLDDVLFFKDNQRNEREDDLQIPPDFYNFQLSFIFPKWISKFFNRENREDTKSIILENLPAHLQPRFYWLSIDEMQQFENIFKDWLAAYDDLKNRDILSNKIAQFLLKNY